MAKSITQFDSINASVIPITRSDKAVSLVCIRLEAGGVLGRHRAVSNQLFLVVAGRGIVSGDDGLFMPITTGQGAYWTKDELHETRTDEGLNAIVIEGDDIVPAMFAADN